MMCENFVSFKKPNINFFVVFYPKYVTLSIFFDALQGKIYAVDIFECSLLTWYEILTFTISQNMLEIRKRANFLLELKNFPKLNYVDERD